jgi:hypothetical protein
MKYYLISIFLLCIIACGEASEETKEAPGAIDNSTQHPNGVTGGAVISTDTGAIVGDSTKLKGDSTRR